jgi:molybdate transport system substrate-binding protein
VPQFGIADAARLLGVRDDTGRRWVAAGALPVHADAANRKVIDAAPVAFARDHAQTAPNPSEVQRSARNRLDERRRRDLRRKLVRIRALAVIAAASAPLLTGCGSSGGTSAPATQTAAPRTLTVLAAASLTETFDALGKQFETDHPGVSVKFNYAGSSDLAQQIVNGAPADVFASASDPTMQTVTDADLTAAKPVTFAKNVLQIATPPGNPKKIATFADLAKPDLKVVVCAPQVPCGAAEQKIEKATGTALKPVSQEADVKSVLSKVETGDADAGLVYVTDVNSAGDKVQGVNFPEAAKASTNYPIAVLKNAPAGDLANQFLTTVTGEQGQKALEQAGFAKP